MELMELAPDGPPRCQIIIPGAVHNNELPIIGKVMRIVWQLRVYYKRYKYPHNYVTIKSIVY